MNKKLKILWCDRNIYRANLTDLLSSSKNMEIATFENHADAVAAFKNDNSYSLVISGNLFEDDNSGITFYKKLHLNSSTHQFLLFTAEVLPQDNPYLILDNFTYFHKDNYTPEVFENLVLGLVNRSVDTEDAHTRIAIIRNYYRLSVGQFAMLLKVTNDTVVKYETTFNVPSSYVLAVCNQFDIPLEFFCSASMETFIERLDNTARKIVKKDVI